jgi:hypothetical protein
MQPAIAKLLRFVEDPTCQHYLDLAHQSYFADFVEAHNLDNFQDILETVGKTAMGQIFPCVFEFFCSNDYRENGKRWNVIDLFLKKRGALLNARDKEYLRSLRQSHMSLYEVLEVELEQSILLRDLIGGGDPVRVFEKFLTRQLSVWDVIGVRVCSASGRRVLAGGAVVLDRDKAIELAQNIQKLHVAGMAFQRAANANDPSLDDYSFEEKERLMKVMWGKEIGLGYLEDCFRKLHREIVLQNSEGHKLQFYTVTFPLNADWKDIALRLNTVKDYHQDADGRARKFWNWIEPMDVKPIPSEDRGDIFVQTIETTLDGADLDAPVRVLGTIELRKTKLVAQANSLERAKRLESKLMTLLDSRIGRPIWEAEETPSGKSPKEIGRSRKSKPLPEPDISPEEQTEILHTMLTQHYRGWLTSAIPNLGNKTPKELSKTKAGREQLVEALKGIENSVRHLERQAGVTRTLSMDWMWEDLGIEKSKMA